MPYAPIDQKAIVLRQLPNRLAYLIEDELKHDRMALADHSCPMHAIRARASDLQTAMEDLDTGPHDRRHDRNDAAREMAIMLVANVVRLLTEGDPRFPRFKPF